MGPTTLPTTLPPSGRTGRSQVSWEGCGQRMHPQELREHPCSRRLWQGACPPWLSRCVAVCGKPSCNVGRSTSRIAPYPSTMSPTSWPCSTMSWLSGNLHQPQRLLEQQLHLQGTTSSPSPCPAPQCPHCTSQANHPLPSLSLLAPLSPLCTPTPPAEKSPRPSGLL